MARKVDLHFCKNCGHESPKWQGQCPGCNEWNSLVPAPTASPGKVSGSVGKALALEPQKLGDVAATLVARYETGIEEFDRVIGGGIVPGSLVLIGGSPGIGKSTLTTMALAELASRNLKTLYVSGEESVEQVRLRAERISKDALAIPIIAETSLEIVAATIERELPQVCVIDSIQTLRSEEFSGAAGSAVQVRESAAALMEVAKRHSVAILLVGHVTKDGALAGPRTLEHVVDCVLQFEGDQDRSYRVLRAIKNRFGSVAEAGVFEMYEHGLQAVDDASARFVGQAVKAPGSVVFAAMEGTRPLLVEVQALVSPSELAQPRRVANGLDRNRVALVLAVLGRHGRLPLASCDVFVNVVGGVRADEPAADLAIALAVASAYYETPLTDRGGELPLVCFGEIGLTGEIRPVSHSQRRVAEAVRFGLKPEWMPLESEVSPAGIETIRAAIESLFDSNKASAPKAVREPSFT